MAKEARTEKQVIHGQEVEVTVLPMADVTGEFPYRPNVCPRRSEGIRSPAGSSLEPLVVLEDDPE